MLANYSAINTCANPSYYDSIPFFRDDEIALGTKNHHIEPETYASSMAIGSKYSTET